MTKINCFQFIFTSKALIFTCQNAELVRMKSYLVKTLVVPTNKRKLNEKNLFFKRVFLDFSISTFLFENSLCFKNLLTKATPQFIDLNFFQPVIKLKLFYINIHLREINNEVINKVD